MSDLISRSALLEEYDKNHVGAPGGARKLIEAAPTIDAVPVDKIMFLELSVDKKTKTAKAVFELGNRKFQLYLPDVDVDVAPVVNGRWVHTDKAAGWFSKDECSECHYHHADRYDLSFFNFCPNCGAKMDGEADA